MNKKRTILIFLIILCASNTFAQSGYGTTSVSDTGKRGLPTDKVFTLPPNQFWDAQNWKDSVYRFVEFQAGRLEFANGFSPSTQLVLNYNTFLETIDVKDEKGIGILKELPELKMIHIGDHKFIHDPAHGYLEIILDGNLSVAKKSFMSAKVGTSNGFIYPMTGMDVKTQTHQFARYYEPTKLLYILDQAKVIHRVGTRVLPSLLPSMKGNIKDFVRVNDIDYRKEEDVLKVVRFCNENYAVAR